MARPCKSPCTGHCSLNRQQICVGCGRTRSEITGWRAMSEEEQKETIKRCEERIKENDGNKEV